MKKILPMTAALLLLTVVGCQCPCGLFSKKENVESIVAKMQKAIDVSGKQDKITSAVLVYDSGLGDKKKSKITLKIKEPRKIRLEVRNKNSVIIKAYNGKTAWEYVSQKVCVFSRPKNLES